MTAHRNAPDRNLDDRKLCSSSVTDSFDSGYEHSVERFVTVLQMVEEDQDALDLNQSQALRMHA